MFDRSDADLAFRQCKAWLADALFESDQTRAQAAESNLRKALRSKGGVEAALIELGEAPYLVKHSLPRVWLVRQDVVQARKLAASNGRGKMLPARSEAMPSADQLATEFAVCMLDAIGPRQLAEVVRRNATPAYERFSTCASHDFVDANMVMLQACNGFDAQVDSDDVLDGPWGDLWQRAWALARLCVFEEFLVADPAFAPVEDASWTAEDQAAALLDGWALFNTGESRMEIQRLDEAAVFESDDAARAHVLAKATEDPLGLHAKALRWIG